MPDERYKPGALPSRRVPRPRELLFEFIRESDRAQFRCELRYHGDDWGVEAQVLMNGDLLVAQRFDAKALAVQWAQLKRDAIEKGGA